MHIVLMFFFETRKTLSLSCHNLIGFAFKGQFAMEAMERSRSGGSDKLGNGTAAREAVMHQAS